MKSLRDSTSKIQSGTADGWPDWTDDHRYSPSEPDEREASEALNDSDWHDLDGPDPNDPIWDQWAEEAANRERAESGLIPL